MEVVVSHISKSYSKGLVKALNEITFNVNKGELFGLIGPDGSGKTSLFRILTTLLLPDAGSASVGGLDVVKNFKEIRKLVGYMPGKFSLYQDLTVEENLNFFATVFNTTLKSNYHLIESIYKQLEPFKNRRAGNLSGGMKQKLALCCALIHKPRILFLDEPTTGVDTVSRKEFWQMLKNLNQQGISILVSTPYMDEAELCQRIALIQQGKILVVNTPEKIKNQFPEVIYAVKAANMSSLLRHLREEEEIKNCYTFGEYHHITFKTNDQRAADRLAEALTKKQAENLNIKKIEPTIEDCFISLMQ